MASDSDSGSPRGGRRSLSASPTRRRSMESPLFFASEMTPSVEDVTRTLEHKLMPSDLQTPGSRRATDISKSVKLDDGPPARHQLKVQRLNLDGLSDEDSKLRRFTVGNRDDKYPNKTILLVGATGSGKSTLINALVNFVMGVKFEDKVWFQIVEEEKNRPQTETQTSAVSVYEVFGFEEKTVPYSLSIIDTPGFRGTRGPEYDEVIKHLQALLSIPDGVKTIDAVGLVLKASVNRLDDRTASIFNSVTSLFGRDLEQNTVALMTHSDGREPSDALRALEEAKVQCARDQNDDPVHFCFNNRQKEKIEDGEAERAEKDFEMSNNGLEDLTEFLGRCRPQSLMKTQLRKGVHLKACIQNLKERVQTILMKEKVIETNKEELIKYEEEMKKNEDFTINVVEHYREKETIPGSGFWGWAFRSGATVCDKCEENCHYPGCTIALSSSRCEAMKNGRCTSCSGKCPAEDHVKDNKIYVNKTRIVKKIDKEMKARYEKNKAQSEEKTSQLEDLEKELAALQRQRKMCLYEAEQIKQQINQNPDSVSKYDQLDSLIEKMMLSGAGVNERMDERRGQTRGTGHALSLGQEAEFWSS